MSTCPTCGQTMRRTLPPNTPSNVRKKAQALIGCKVSVALAGDVYAAGTLVEVDEEGAVTLTDDAGETLYGWPLLSIEAR